MPLALATGIGSTAPCTAHSNNVCFFDSATISSLVNDNSQLPTPQLPTLGVGPLGVGSYQRVPRFRKAPLPGLPVNWPFSMMTRPRDSTVSATPVTSRPSYGL